MQNYNHPPPTQYVVKPKLLASFANGAHSSGTRKNSKVFVPF
jgi:hypothetical protein